MINFSIVIPIYNEEKNLINLIEEINLYLKDYTVFEIIIVNDGSTDNTLEIIKKISTKYSIKLRNNKINRGQSFALMDGVTASKYKTIVTLDGDGQNHPKNIPALVEKYFNDKNLYLVGGIRIKRKDTLIKIISSKIANKFRSLILKDNCNDTGCSLKVFDRDSFIEFHFFDGIHRFLPALFSGFGKKTFFINVDHRPRIHGVSKYGTFGRLFRGIRDLIKVVKIIKKFKRNCA